MHSSFDSKFILMGCQLFWNAGKAVQALLFQVALYQNAWYCSTIWLDGCKHARPARCIWMLLTINGTHMSLMKVEKRETCTEHSFPPPHSNVNQPLILTIKKNVNKITTTLKLTPTYDLICIVTMVQVGPL